MDIHTVSLKGKRYQNEDKHNIIINLDKNDKTKAPINFFGLYDGHGGKYVSKYLSENCQTFFMDPRVKYPLNTKYIHSVYNYINNSLKNKHKAQSLNCGSTCLLLQQYKAKNNMYLSILNSGDCRAVLCRNNMPLVLTKDHKPSWPEEKRRIEQLGGNIYQDNAGDWRIKDLSVSRAFGDFDTEPFITCLPDIYNYKIHPEDKFIILACDGLWDVMKNEDVVNFILNECYDDTLKKRIKNNNNIAKKLAEHAINIGSMDNVSIIVIFLI
jgi:serine/threonine protein phosphatase PrpC